MSHLLLAAFFAAATGIPTRRIITPIVSFFVTLLVSYFALPTMSFGFGGLPFLILLNGGIAWAIEGIHAFDNYQYGYKRQIGPGAITVIGILMLTVVPFVSSSAFFHAASYRNLIGQVEKSTFSTDTSPLDPTQVRVVDQGVAMRLGEKRLGENAALGSIVDLGEPRIQKFQDELYWVVPLNHSGFWRYQENSQGTPGYILVSATNERDVRLVQEIDGKPIRLKYNMGSCFGDYPPRYLYQNGYMSSGLTDYTLEIDDTGRPYWVVTKFEKRVGYAGKDPIAVVVLDAQTGEIDEYNIDDAPEWIDRIQPSSIVVDQLNDWGRYINGWWNPSSEDELKVSSGISLVYGDDGQSYWYTGITSVGADESTVGFVLVNTRTKETRLYEQAGATEEAAKRSAQGSVQEKGYHATDPILYNVGGYPTYFLTLKDQAGLVKMMSFVSVESYQIVGFGENVRDALSQYQRALASHGNEIVAGGAVLTRTVSGTVKRITQDTSGNYYLLVGGHENKAFIGDSGLSLELPFSQVGDRVTIEFSDGGNEAVYLTNFENAALSFQKTDDQIGVEQRAETVREGVQSRRAEQNANAAWEDLSAEEKARLIEGARRNQN